MHADSLVGVENHEESCFGSKVLREEDVAFWHAGDAKDVLGGRVGGRKEAGVERQINSDSYIVNLSRKATFVRSKIMILSSVKRAHWSL